jgi:hypothetical protein
MKPRQPHQADDHDDREQDDHLTSPAERIPRIVAAGLVEVAGE